jgi:hypothetical protein
MQGSTTGVVDDQARERGSKTPLKKLGTVAATIQTKPMRTVCLNMI